jgi:hypothetical protein
VFPVNVPMCFEELADAAQRLRVGAREVAGDTG